MMFHRLASTAFHAERGGSTTPRRATRYPTTLKTLKLDGLTQNFSEVPEKS
jgi:hypothetical protein